MKILLWINSVLYMWERNGMFVFFCSRWQHAICGNIRYCIVCIICRYCRNIRQSNSAMATKVMWYYTSLIWHKNIYLFNWSWQSLMIGFHTDVAEWLDDEQNEWQKNLICRRSELQLRKKTDQEILENINRIPFWVMQTFIWTIFLQKMNLLEVIHIGQGICI